MVISFSNFPWCGKYFKLTYLTKCSLSAYHHFDEHQSIKMEPFSYCGWLGLGNMISLNQNCLLQCMAIIHSLPMSEFCSTGNEMHYLFQYIDI